VFVSRKALMFSIVLTENERLLFEVKWRTNTKYKGKEGEGQGFKVWREANSYTVKPGSETSG